MVFSSHFFLFYFLPTALAVYYVSPRRVRHLGLTILSYGFYGWANPLFLVLLLGTTTVDYLAALGMARRPLPVGGARTVGQWLWLLLSLVANLGMLGFFKYYNFGLENYNAMAATLGLPPAGAAAALNVVLPLGISFYTFQSLSYTIDVYRGHARATRNFIDFACFVSMFPQLVAGPIIRYSEVADQLAFRIHSSAKFARGVAFLSLGLAKKVLLANPCGKIADTVFDAAGASTLDSWYGAVAYAFQIYFDFSGYSDMAIGLGLMMGFMFAKNFNSPYRSRSITEFWQRWHISLSTWLRDYLYIPLGGNRHGLTRTCINIAIVMLLGGLWHGSRWTFIAWGAIHGTMLIIERIRNRRPILSFLPGPVRLVSTFAIVVVSWVFFRSVSLSAATQYLGAMFGLGETPAGAILLGGLIYQPYYLAVMAAAGLVTWLMPQTWDFTRELRPWKAVLILLLLWIAIAVLATQAYNPFIYFIF